jgi:flotillin
MFGLFDINGGVVAVIIPVIIIVLLFAYATSRVKVAGANEALVRTGGVLSAPAELKVVRAGRVIVLPLVHRLGRLHLSARQININLSDAVTKQGIKCMVQGVATVKIGGDEESIRNAAERFLDKEDLLDSIVKNVLEGSLRSIVGTLTVEELNYDRQKFQQEVQGAAKADLATSGLAIDNFTIQAIRDEVGYMDLIGQQETARRERDARMAKATADQEAAVREAESQQIKLNAQRDVSLRQADVEAQTAAAQAKAAQAGPLAQAEAQQEVVRRQTELAQLEADRRQKELIASTIRPAEADAEAQIRRAEGDKGARIAAAQADAERVKLAGQAEAAVQVVKGEAQARVTEVNAEAIAKQTTLEGNAEAGIVFTKGEAEAKALGLRADAYRQFNEAAIISTVLSMLPEIVRAAAEPIGQIGSLTVLSTDGAADIVKTTTRTLAEASASVKGLTGIDIPELLNSALGGESRIITPERPRRKPTDEGGPGGGGGAGRPRGGGSPTGGSGGGSTGGASGSGGSGRASSSGGSGGVSEGGSPAGGSGGSGASGSSGGGAPAGGTGEGASSAGQPSASTASTTPSAAAGSVAAAAATWAAQSQAATPAPTPAERFESAAKAMESAQARATAPTAKPLGGLSSPMPPMPPVTDLRPGDRRRLANTAAAAVGLNESSTMSESAQRLAQELIRIPGIERFGGTRLRDLDQSGPRSLRVLWGAARDELSSRYGDVTIGTLLDAYTKEHSSGGPR